MGQSGGTGDAGFTQRRFMALSLGLGDHVHVVNDDGAGMSICVGYGKVDGFGVQDSGAGRCLKVVNLRLEI